MGRLHELAVTRPRVPTSHVWARHGAYAIGGRGDRRRAGEALIRHPQVAEFATIGQDKTFGRPHRPSKTALLRWLYLDAMRRPDPPVAALDETASFERFDFSSVTDAAIDPFEVAPVPSTSSRDTTGEW
ncbi:MAG: hypothetical protein WKF79_03115 [Nocardioides sp.]